MCKLFFKYAGWKIAKTLLSLSVLFFMASGIILEASLIFLSFYLLLLTNIHTGLALFLTFLILMLLHFWIFSPYVLPITMESADKVQREISNADVEELIKLHKSS